MKGGIINLIIPLLAALFISSCAPKVVGIYNTEVVGKQPSSFYINSPDEGNSLSEKEQLFNEQLISIIKVALESKKLNYSSLPDLYVSYMINVHRTQETNETNFSQFDQNQYYNNRYYDPTRFETRTFKEGVLIIDIKNHDNKLVWQGSRNFKLKTKESVQTVLPAICEEVITSFDPLKLR